MRVVLQRVTRASVSVGGETIAAIQGGLLALVGVAEGDDEGTSRTIARKCAELRIFSDDAGQMNRSLLETGGDALVVSQFTLLADVRRGRRPSFTDAAAPGEARRLFDVYTDELASLGIHVATGEFGASMQVELTNDGPVTIVIDSADLARPRKS